MHEHSDQDVKDQEYEGDDDEKGVLARGNSPERSLDR